MPEKTKGPRTLLITCPYCSHEQREPASVLSTYCRNCSSHYQVSQGQPLRAGLPTLNTHEETITSFPVIPRPPLRKESSGQNSSRHRSTSKGFEPSTPNSENASEKELECIDCGHLHLVSRQSSSSLCPRCGSYVSLKDYDIKEPWTRQIRTRGDVYLHQEGSLTGTSVTCRHFTVEGSFNGSAECDGDLTIRQSCRILGHVRCKRLIIGNQSEVEFTSSVQAEEVIIDGVVRADITCSGRLELAPMASLQGDINIATLVVSTGATHQGRVSMVTLPTR